MALDKSTVEKIAFLARLAVPEEDMAPLAGDLNGILDWMEQLNEVDTDGVPPMASVADLGLIRRADAVTDGDCADAVLANGPETEDGYFLVPKVVE